MARAIQTKKLTNAETAEIKKQIQRINDTAVHISRELGYNDCYLTNALSKQEVPIRVYGPLLAYLRSKGAQIEEKPATERTLFTEAEKAEKEEPKPVPPVNVFLYPNGDWLDGFNAAWTFAKRCINVNREGGFTEAQLERMFGNAAKATELEYMSFAATAAYSIARAEDY